MDVQTLHTKWAKLTPDQMNGFRSLRLSADCKPDLYIGLDEAGRRCLILKLPNDFRFTIPQSVKENMSLEYFAEKRIIVLRLLSGEYFDLFDDLILSLYNKVKNLTNAKEYINEFVSAYYKWSEFFNDKIKNKLSYDDVKGLFGEIFFLNHLLRESIDYDTNEILLSWKGPYDSVHDFQFPHKSYEVKTKELNASTICISSEYQLQSLPRKTLELTVVEVMEHRDGLSLNDLLLQTRELIKQKYGNLSFLMKALLEKGLTFHNIQEYDTHKFKPCFMYAYDCEKDNFPKLIRQNLNLCIVDLAYSLQINLLSSFIVSKIKINGNY